jgi:hypothetical protein
VLWEFDALLLFGRQHEVLKVVKIAARAECEIEDARSGH